MEIFPYDSPDNSFVMYAKGLSENVMLKGFRQGLWALATELGW